MLTEAEAETKWCPFGRVQNLTCAVNRYHGGKEIHRDSLCIASQCMAWRIDRLNADGRGYCGLAGKPE